jgi:hypothetical protein
LAVVQLVRVRSTDARLVLLEFLLDLVGISLTTAAERPGISVPMASAVAEVA